MPSPFDPESFEGIVTGKLSSIETKLDSLSDSKTDHERRLRWLERLAYGLIGAWVLLSAWLKVHIMGGK